MHPHRHCHLNRSSTPARYNHKDSYEEDVNVQHHRSRWAMAMYSSRMSPPTCVPPGDARGKSILNSPDSLADTRIGSSMSNGSVGCVRFLADAGRAGREATVPLDQILRERLDLRQHANLGRGWWVRSGCCAQSLSTSGGISITVFKASSATSSRGTQCGAVVLKVARARLRAQGHPGIDGSRSPSWCAHSIAWPVTNAVRSSEVL